MENNVSKSKSNYGAKSIKLLKGLEAVRKRPGMYIGSTDEKGVHHCLWEIIDNSVDEYNAGYGNEIIVSLYPNNTIQVQDFGRGVPVDMHEEGLSAATIAMTELHAGGKFDSETYHRSGGLHGVGASVVNALSDKFELTINRDGQTYYQLFHDGGKFDNELMPISELKDSDKTGTTIKFTLNKEVFSDEKMDEEENYVGREYFSFKPETIEKRMELLSYLNSNLKMTFINYEQLDESGNPTVKTWESEKLSDYISVLNKDMGDENTEIYSFQKEVLPKSGSKKQSVNVNIAFQSFFGEQDKIAGFVNNISTPNGGTHVSGFKRALTKKINQYIKDNKVTNDKLEQTDILEGLLAVISVKVTEPMFEGQTKEKLTSKEADTAVFTATYDFLTKLFEENPKVAKLVIERCIRAKRARDAASKARKLSITEKSSSNFTTPYKLAECQEKKAELCELFLVEGDSAGGSAKQGRDRKTQAILPLKGKILNTQKNDMAKILQNKEIQDLISVMGTGVGKDFNIDKLKYHKIIIMTDADVDGEHISTLLISFFYKCFPDLLKKGYIYQAMPPLYRVKRKTGSSENVIYLRNKNSLEDFQTENKDNLKNWSVNRFKGLGEMDASDLYDTTMNPETRVLSQIIYDEEIADEIAEMFHKLLGDDTEIRREFIQTYESGSSNNND